MSPWVTQVNSNTAGQLQEGFGDKHQASDPDQMSSEQACRALEGGWCLSFSKGLKSYLVEFHYFEVMYIRRKEKISNINMVGSILKPLKKISSWEETQNTIQ